MLEVIPIGAEACAKAAPDGYSICAIDRGPLSFQPNFHKKLAYDPARDFEPIANLFNLVQAMVVLPESPAGSIQELIALARAIADGELLLEPGADVEHTIERLRAVPGVGEWTAQYIAMRALSWPNAFPHTDYGVLKAMARMGVHFEEDEDNPKLSLNILGKQLSISGPLAKSVKKFAEENNYL